MPMTEVALAAGFGSLRRSMKYSAIFFIVLRVHYGERLPRALPVRKQELRLRLRYRPPYDWDSMLGHLLARAIPGVEVVENGIYRRTIEMDGSTGSVEVAHLPQRQSLSVTIRFSNVQSLPAIVTRVRRLFDLGADIGTIDEHLSRDPFLAPLVAQRPGLRAPGGWDGFELAVARGSWSASERSLCPPASRDN